MVSGLNRITIGIFVIVGIIIFGMFFAWTQKSEIVVTPGEFMEQKKQDLFPSRSQERVQNIEEKDTSFEESETINPNLCTDYDCFEKYYQKVVAEQTIAEAFVDLQVRYDESALVRSLCHPFVHVIGRAAVEKYPDVAEAYTKGDHFCWSGYYHGVMEKILYDTEAEELPSVVNNICENVPGKATYSFDYYNCVHGLGHGVMYVTDNELFDALILCDSLQGTWEQESCYGGVFMENVITDFENHYTKYLKPEEPLYPCTAVPEKNKHACYLMQTSYVLKTNGYDFADAFEQCSTVKENHQDTCYQSVGRDASGSTVSDVERTKNYCLLGKEYRQQVNCAVGAVKDFISYFHSDVQAKQLCAAFANDKDIEKACLSTADIYYQSFTPPEI